MEFLLQPQKKITWFTKKQTNKQTDMEIIMLNELQARGDLLHTQSRCFEDT